MATPRPYAAAASNALSFVPDAAAQSAPATGAERRRCPREHVVRPCKLLHRGARYIGATTSNVSASGALICVDRARPLAPGDEIEIAIDWMKAAVLTGASMTRARVVRITPMDHHHQAVAVVYERAGEMAKAA